MGKKFALMVLGALLLSIGLACSQGQPTQAPVTPAKATTEAPSKPAWQQEWEKTVAAAKQEGTVSIITVAGSSQTAAWREGFKKAYGIDTEFIASGSATELIQKLISERQAGLYIIDVFLTGARSYFTDLKPKGLIDPMKPQLLLPEVIDPKAWYGGKLPFMDNDGQWVFGMSFYPGPVIAVNTDLMKPDAIKTTKDLLDPKLKGNIILYDPAIGGGGRTWAGMAYMITGPEFLQQFGKQEPVVTRDSRLQLESLARGKYPVAVGIEAQGAAEFIKVGAPISYVYTSDLIWATCGMTPALINRAPHPNAAKVFLNWLLTKEGQTINSKALLQQSARLDVPTDHLPAAVVRQPGMVYLASDQEDLALKRDTAADEAVKVMGIGK